MIRRRLPITIAAWLALAALATADAPTPRAAPASGAVLSGPAGVYAVTAPAPVRVIYGPSSITIDWTGGIDPTPVPVPPTPVPPDPPTPEPPPVPVPAWGPLARVIVLYESSLMTGREPIYATSVSEALSAACPAGPDGRPSWRVWDKDLDVSKEPTWVDAMAKAKAALSGPGPVLFAFDDKGRVKEVPLPATMTPAEAVAAIQSLRGARP